MIAIDTAELVEHTDQDTYWADGGDGSGMNMLGRMLMKVREELSVQSGGRRRGFQWEMPLDQELLVWCPACGTRRESRESWDPDELPLVIKENETCPCCANIASTFGYIQDWSNSFEILSTLEARSSAAVEAMSVKWRNAESRECKEGILLYHQGKVLLLTFSFGFKAYHGTVDPEFRQAHLLPCDISWISGLRTSDNEIT